MTTRVTRRASGSSRFSTRFARELGDRMLGELGLEHLELSVLLTGDREIEKLNRVHRGKLRPTDVLAFPLDGTKDSDGLLGDVVISLDTALRQANGRRRPVEEEVRFLLAHGLAHLLGHDHATAAQKARMDRVTRRLVRAATRRESVARAFRRPRRVGGRTLKKHAKSSERRR